MIPLFVCHAGEEAITVVCACQQISQGKQAVPTRSLGSEKRLEMSPGNAFDFNL